MDAQWMLSFFLAFSLAPKKARFVQPVLLLSPYWGCPRTRVVAAPTGLPDVFSPWEALDRARQGMLTQVLYPRVCSPEAAFCEGVKANPFRVNAARAAQILPLSPHRWGPTGGPIWESGRYHLQAPSLGRGSTMKRKVEWD